jgi:hypothetical protein
MQGFVDRNFVEVLDVLEEVMSGSSKVRGYPS